MSIVTVVGVTKREEKRIPNSVMKLDLSGTRKVTTDARQKMLSYMLSYVNYTSHISQKERITQCKHEFDTQVNEGMNTCVAKYAPKNRHYSKSISLEARMKITAGIYNCGYHFFWTEVMKELEIESDVSLQVYLLRKDKDKLKKYTREHDHANMAKRKANEHAKLRKELDARYKNIAKNME